MRFFYWGLGSQLPLHPTEAAYQEPMGRASNRLIASDLSCGCVVALKQKNVSGGEFIFALIGHSKMNAWRICVRLEARPPETVYGERLYVPVGHIWKFDLERSKKHLILE